jgi:hypothetical protein
MGFCSAFASLSFFHRLLVGVTRGYRNTSEKMREYKTREEDKPNNEEEFYNSAKHVKQNKTERCRDGSAPHLHRYFYVTISSFSW